VNVLVTGASGFIGGALVPRLRARGDAVRVLVRRTSARAGLEALGVDVVFGDLATGEGLDAAVDGADAVIHLAGLTRARDEEAFHRGNEGGTRNLLRAMARRRSPPRLVHCSSLAAAGPSTAHRPRDESQEPRPLSAYGRSKLAAEAAVREFAGRIPSLVVRPPIVYGPGDRVNLPPLLTMARLGIFVKPGRALRRFSFIHVEDLCAALEAALERGRTVEPGQLSSGIYFVADPDVHTWDGFCSAVSRALGRGRATILPVPEFATGLVGAAVETVGRMLGHQPIINRDKVREMLAEAWTCSPQRAEAELGFAPRWTPLEAGLANTLDWYRRIGQVPPA
jgi:nucleoside-diphosphate-sugar epimerase